MVAQLVRVQACHAGVAGSSPVRRAKFQNADSVGIFYTRVISSVGRASALQAECRRFDSVITHQVFFHCCKQWMHDGSSVG